MSNSCNISSVVFEQNVRSLRPRKQMKCEKLCHKNYENKFSFHFILGCPISSERFCGILFQDIK
jgi:hypothetical protein